MSAIENPITRTLTCPDCGHEAESQGGTSYYKCPDCDLEFDRDEVNADGTWKDDGDEGWDDPEPKDA